MKSRVILSAITILMAISITLLGQAPQQFNYQAVLRNNGNVIVSGSVSVRFTIHDGSPVGSIVYQEAHTATTDAYGLVNVAIGNGTVLMGDFSTINWGNGAKHLQVEVDNGAGYTDMGTHPFRNVPYALYAGSAEGGWKFSGNATNSSDFLGTTNTEPLSFKQNNQPAGFITLLNTALGTNALSSVTTGDYNTTFGFNALREYKISVKLGTDISTEKLQDKAITADKLDDMSADPGEILKWNGRSWEPIPEGTVRRIHPYSWNLNGNNVDNTNFLGTTNNVALRFKQNNVDAGLIDGNLTALGKYALSQNTSGVHNTAYGSQTLRLNLVGTHNTAIGSDALRDNITGNRNTAVGVSALANNYSGDFNTAIGYDVMIQNFTGTNNTAIGKGALRSNHNGSYNSAVGVDALYSNTTGNYNSAFGKEALKNNSTGLYNSAFGSDALNSNTTASNNSAFGSAVLRRNTTGHHNAAFGSISMGNNIDGDKNSAFGSGALAFNLTGSYNSAFGYKALYNQRGASHNAAFGFRALENNLWWGNCAFGSYSLQFNNVGFNNIAIGYKSLRSLNEQAIGNIGIGTYSYIVDDVDNSVAIGYYAQVRSSNTITLGNPATQTIGGFEPWSNVSDVRFKTRIKPLQHGLDFILRLRPITYHLKMSQLTKSLQKGEGEVEESKEPAWIDEAIAAKEATQYTGFSAQQVEKVAKSIGYEFSGVNPPKVKGSHYTLSYSTFVVPLVKAVQQQQEMIDEQQKTIEQQLSSIEQLQQSNKKILERLLALEKKNKR